MPSNSSILGSDTIWNWKPGAAPTEDVYGHDTLFYTSTLYPISLLDSMQAAGGLQKVFEPWHGDFTAELQAGGAVIAFAQYRQYPHPYTDWPVESIESAGELVGIDRTNLVPTYPKTYAYQESLAASGGLVSITKTTVTPISYSNWPVESLNSSGQLIGIVTYV